MQRLPSFNKVTVARMFMWGVIVFLLVGVSASNQQWLCVVDSPKMMPQFLPWPNYGEAAISSTADMAILTHGKMVQMPMASTAKLITALTVLQKYPLAGPQSGPRVVFTKADIDRLYEYQDMDGAILPIIEGDSMSEYDAIQSMLLPSANNIADTLAIWAFGDMANYSEAASQYIAQLGLKNTTIGTDASGFSASSSSTAIDLVLLGKAVLSDPVLSTIVAKQSATIKGLGNVQNTNKLVGRHGVIGIKTGNTDYDKGVYIFAVKQRATGGLQTTVVGAIMGAPSVSQAFSDAIPLATFASQAAAYR